MEYWGDLKFDPEPLVIKFFHIHGSNYREVIGRIILVDGDNHSIISAKRIVSVRVNLNKVQAETVLVSDNRGSVVARTVIFKPLHDKHVQIGVNDLMEMSKGATDEHHLFVEIDGEWILADFTVTRTSPNEWTVKWLGETNKVTIRVIDGKYWLQMEYTSDNSAN